MFLQVSVCSQGGSTWSGGVSAPGVPGGDPPGQLLLRAVRILLECILVLKEISHTRIEFYREGPFKVTFAEVCTLIKIQYLQNKMEVHKTSVRSARINHRDNLKCLQTFWNTKDIYRRSNSTDSILLNDL